MIDTGELERLKKICEVAIAENWVIEFNMEKDVINVYANNVSDAEFIAESPMVILKLIAEIESLQAKLEVAKEVFQWVANDGERSPEGYILSSRLEFVEKATEALSKINFKSDIVKNVISPSYR